LTDWIYRVPAFQCARAQRRAGGRSWNYLFSYGSEPYGAGHSVDTLFFYDRIPAELLTDEAVVRVRDNIVSSMISFIISGDPGWPECDPKGGTTTRDFGGPYRLVREPSGAAGSLWETLDDNTAAYRRVS
jgi:hypothetical protein